MFWIRSDPAWKRSFFRRSRKIPPSGRLSWIPRVPTARCALRVEALLKAHDNAGGFPGRPGRPAVPTLTGFPTHACQTCLPHDETLEFLDRCDTPGRLGLLAHYEILEILGRGGMGIVLRGVDVKLNRVVAIKVLAPQLAANATARQRFLREAQAAAAVSHDHVVAIHAVDEFNGLAISGHGVYLRPVAATED